MTDAMTELSWELVASAASGDKTAVERIVRALERPVYAVALRMLHDARECIVRCRIARRHRARRRLSRGRRTRHYGVVGRLVERGRIGHFDEAKITPIGGRLPITPDSRSLPAVPPRAQFANHPVPPVGRTPVGRTTIAGRSGGVGSPGEHEQAGSNRAPLASAPSGASTERASDARRPVERAPDGRFARLGSG